MRANGEGEGRAGPDHIGVLMKGLQAAICSTLQLDLAECYGVDTSSYSFYNSDPPSPALHQHHQTPIGARLT